ncbi:DNA topoisomerase VI subunit B, partial [Candidatus Woesearchaeota archaeon]|nr:DNA topoisomerase VI subunit B [Candidatus Woesearchaeota archaeon]
HGTRIELDLEGSYQKGQQSVDEYIKETAVTNPHVTLIYVNPKAEQFVFARATNKKPVEAKEIKPHPYGVELGVLMKMLQDTDKKTLQQFFQTEFSRVSPAVAKEICANARLQTKDKPKRMGRDQTEALINGIKEAKIMAPPTDCLSPIGAELLEKGLKKEINAEFYIAVTRSPVVYKGNPFQVEVALAWGGDQPGDKQAKLMRFANRVPLLYQQGACGTTKAVTSTKWKSYGMQQSNGNLPLGPLTIAVHIASVWVPFTSESKEAIAHYEDILKEIRLALQEAGRELGKYVAKKQRVKHEIKKRSYIQKYIPKLAEATATILKLGKEDVAIMEAKLEKMLEKQRGKLDTMEFDPSKNVEFDAEHAKIGKKE